MCQEAGITVSVTTPASHMSRVLDIRRMGPSVLRLQVQTVLQRSSGDERALRNFLFHSPYRSPTLEDRLYESLEEEQGALRNLTVLRKRTIPESPVQALALGASIYKIDLSSSDDPTLSYLELREGKEITDGRLRELQTKNPRVVHMEYSFNPMFPPSYYPVTALRTMARSEGHTPEELSRSCPYQLLCESQVINTFYLWKNLPCTEVEVRSSVTISGTTRFSLETWDECDRSECLFYGSLEKSRGRVTGRLFLTTFSEMEICLRGSQTFDDPFYPGEKFHPRAITKLQLLASDSHPEVERQITIIRKIQQIGNLRMKAFVQEYYRAKDRPSIHQGLDLLLHTAMTMRGWRGEGPYPISRCPPNPNELERDLQLNRLMAELERKDHELTRQSPHLSILQLPLMRYRDGNYEFGTDDQGITIADRLRIVRDQKELPSCIRMTSNWLACCAYKYKKMLDLPLPFSISELEHIT